MEIIKETLTQMMRDVDAYFDQGQVVENPWRSSMMCAEHIISVTGRGKIYGYKHIDNPTAMVASGPKGELYGSHYFAVIDECIVDHWAADYFETEPMLHLDLDKDRIQELYGDAEKWVRQN